MLCYIEKLYVIRRHLHYWIIFAIEIKENLVILAIMEYVELNGCV